MRCFATLLVAVLATVHVAYMKRIRRIVAASASKPEATLSVDQQGLYRSPQGLGQHGLRQHEVGGHGHGQHVLCQHALGHHGLDCHGLGQRGLGQHLAGTAWQLAGTTQQQALYQISRTALVTFSSHRLPRTAGSTFEVA